MQVDALKNQQKSIFKKTNFESQLFLSAFNSPNDLQCITSRKQHVHIDIKHIKECLTTNCNLQYIWLALLSLIGLRFRLVSLRKIDFGGWMLWLGGQAKA